jgi:hypothetical protein
MGDFRAENVFIVGGGNVTQARYIPSCLKLRSEGRIGRLHFADVRSQEEVFPNGLPPDSTFTQIPNGQLPISELRRKRAITADTLVAVNTPTPYHVPYARQLAPYVGRVGVEKPLSQSTREAMHLLDLEDRVFPIGHQLFKPEVLSLNRKAGNGDLPVEKIGCAEFRLFEKIGVGGRQIDDCVWDLAWHGFECMLSPLVAQNESFQILIESSKVSTYHDGPDFPSVWTAARVDGILQTNLTFIPFSIRVGKGLCSNDKRIELYDSNGWRIAKATLNEDIHSSAHERLLRELAGSPSPNMQLTMRDVIAVVEACQQSVRKSIELPGYKFGCTPHWLAETKP